MAAGFVVLQLIVVFLISALILHKYGNWRKQLVVVTVSTLVSWYFAFMIVFLIPLDVVLTFYLQCVKNVLNSTSTTTFVHTADINQSHSSSSSLIDLSSNTCRIPKSYISRESLLTLWEFVYWTSQVLTWLILPIMQSYCKSGEFSALGKLRTALIENAIYYASYLLLFGILLIYVAAHGSKLTGSNLKTICITASNTWGLFWFVILSGYGLVEVPRRMWLSGFKGYMLQKTYFDVEKLATDKNDAEENLREAYREAKAALENTRTHGQLRIFAETIMEKFPDSVAGSLNRRTETSSTYRVSAIEAATMPDERSLANLHKRSIDAVSAHNRCEAQWNALINRALHLEDVARNEQNTADKIFVRSTKRPRGALEEIVCVPRIEWIWECMCKRPLLKVFAIFCALMSAMIVWSEVTYFSARPVLSLAAVFVRLAAKNSDYNYIEVSSIITIAYLCLCAYYTVFRIRIYRYYHLDPHHQSDENSLLFSAILFCRLTPPLCLNFLSMIHMDSHVTRSTALSIETAYTSFMGHMDVVPFISKGFFVYFPMAILLLCLGTYFRLGTRCLHYIGVEQFIDDDDMTAELVQGGKALVAAERNKLQRVSDREARDEFWRDKLGDHDPSKPLRRSLAARPSYPGGSVPEPTPNYGDRALIVENAEPIATVQDDGGFNDVNNWFTSTTTSGGGGSRNPGSRSNFDSNKGIFDDL